MRASGPFTRARGCGPYRACPDSHVADRVLALRMLYARIWPHPRSYACSASRPLSSSPWPGPPEEPLCGSGALTAAEPLRRGCGQGRALGAGWHALARGRETGGRWRHPHLPRLERDSLAAGTSAATSLAHADLIVPPTPTLGPEAFLRKRTLLPGHSTEDLPTAHILAGSPDLTGLVIWSTFECPSAETAPCNHALVRPRGPGFWRTAHCSTCTESLKQVFPKVA